MSFLKGHTYAFTKDPAIDLPLCSFIASRIFTNLLFATYLCYLFEIPYEINGPRDYLLDNVDFVFITTIIEYMFSY